MDKLKAKRAKTRMVQHVVETFDNRSVPVKHGRARVNGIRLHYITAGDDAAKDVLLLLHGTPKDSFYWHKLMPLLTATFRVVAPDLRGFGYSDKPPAADGYDCVTNAHDVAALMARLGFDKFHVHVPRQVVGGGVRGHVRP